MYSNKWPMGTRVPAKTGTPLIFSGSTSTTSLIFIVLFLAAILALEFTKVPSTCVGFMPCGVWAPSTHYSEWIVLCFRISVASHRQECRGFQSMTPRGRLNRGGADSRCPSPGDPLQSYPEPFSAGAG